ncbi:MAG: cytidine deaminase [bacterium]
MDKELVINYQEYESTTELAKADCELMQRAVEAASGAYAPYSDFRVGAALRLKDGTVVVGSNQENIAYPSGLCAERTAIFAASAQRPECRDYEALAIVGRNAEGWLCEASPCGACRQVMAEYEQRQGHPMRVICYLEGGRVRVIPRVADLLPFSFAF